MRRALLFTCSLGTLSGAARSAEVMAATLARRGFICCIHSDEHTTRAGVETALRSLSEHTTRGDAVVIYYAGHGFAESYSPPEGAPVCTYILAASDLADSTPGDFRGLFAHDLRRMIRPIAANTDDIIVILDACHAAGLARIGASPSPPIDPGVLAHMHAEFGRRAARVRTAGPARGVDDVVYVAASTDHEIAQQTIDADGQSICAFTHSLVRTLESLADTGVNWDELVFAAAARMPLEASRQLPGVGGRRERRVFQPGILPVCWLGALREDGTVLLRAGSLATIAVGDIVLLAPLLADATVIPGEVVVVDALSAIVRCEIAVPPDPPIFRVVGHRDRAAPAIAIEGDLPAALRASPDFTITTTDPLALLRCDDMLRLYEGGDELACWASTAVDIHAELRRWLARLIACHALIGGGDARTPAFTVEVSHPDGSRLSPNEPLEAGAHLRIRVHNLEPRELYFAVFHIDAVREIRALSHAVHGVALPPRYSADVAPDGVRLPVAVRPADASARTERLVVLAATEPLIGVHTLVVRGSHGRRRPVRTEIVALRVHPPRDPHG